MTDRPSGGGSGGATVRIIEYPWLPVVIVVLLSAVVVVVMFGWAPTEAELPFPDTIRDGVWDQITARAARDGTTPPSINPRTSGAMLMLQPMLLIPSDYVTWSVSVASVASVGFLMAAVVKLTPGHHVAHVLAAMVFPVSLAFTQTVYYGNTFFVLAAAMVWAWLLSIEDREVAAGILIGCAGVMRLWPFLVVVALARHRRVRAVASALTSGSVLMAAGLLLPGVTFGSMFDQVIEGGSTWIGAQHNGSLASIMADVGVPGAAFVALAVVLGAWSVVLFRSSGLWESIAVAYTAAVFASPLAWPGYLAILLPVPVRWAGAWAGGFLAVVQVLGFLLLPHRMTFVVSYLVIALILVREVSRPRELVADTSI